MKNVDKEIHETIDRIGEKLNNVEEMLMWTIRASDRFVVGQRVQWSDIAKRKQYFIRRNAPKRGTVKGVDGISVKVLLDGRKHPSGYHHMFFDKIGRSKR